ncbi:MAG: hypothetical protein JRH19_27400 [Deltaproteobacteria bacterium]|nr:hypothetical protein [Deltaproteobacteria bacterium]
MAAEKRRFDPAYAGKRAECDGGGPIPGTRMAGRQEFTGTLTGEYIEQGDPPWRWYLMVDLVVTLSRRRRPMISRRAPGGFEECEDE